MSHGIGDLRKVHVRLSDFYKDFIKSLVERQKKQIIYTNSSQNMTYTYNLTAVKYKKILSDLIHSITDAMIYNGYVWNMPYDLGTLRIVKWKVKYELTKKGNLKCMRLPINWKATRDLWRKKYGELTFDQMRAIRYKPLIFHENIETDGYRYRYVWDNKQMKLRNRNVYTFCPVRGQNPTNDEDRGARNKLHKAIIAGKIFRGIPIGLAPHDRSIKKSHKQTVSV